MSRLSYTANKIEYWLERVNGGKEIGIFAYPDSPEPVDTVEIPYRYSKYKVEADKRGGNHRKYSHTVTWLVGNVPGIPRAIEEKVGIRQQIGV